MVVNTTGLKVEVRDYPSLEMLELRSLHTSRMRLADLERRSNTQRIAH